MRTKKLPIGIQDFEKLRKKNCYYVDKTHLIKKLIDDGYCYFLSRPRRFGKSITLSTIQCLFEGKKELFEGLFIYNNWDFCEKNKHPVIRISFEKGRNNTQNRIDKNIISQLESIEKAYGIEPEQKTGLDKFFIGLTNFCSELELIKHPSRGINKFTKLLSKLHRKTGKKVVILKSGDTNRRIPQTNS